MSHLKEAFDVPELVMKASPDEAGLALPASRYLREAAALEAAEKDTQELLSALAGSRAGKTVACEFAWADAPNPKEAIFALLDGQRVYDSRDLAVKMTGREPVLITIVARSNT